MLKLKQIEKPASSDDGSVVVFNGTVPTWSSTVNGGILIPRGTTAQRPANPKSGMTRFNTDLSVIETFDDLDWVPVGSSDGHRIVSDDENTWVDTQSTTDTISFGIGQEFMIVNTDADYNAILSAINTDSNIVLKPNGTGSVVVETDGTPAIEANIGEDFMIIGDSIILYPRADGKVTIRGDGPSLIETPLDEPLTIKTGDSVTGNGTNLTLRGGSTAFETGTPGNIVFEVGNNSEDNTHGQLLALGEYVPAEPQSIITKQFMEDYVAGAVVPETVTIVTADATLTLAQTYIVVRSSNDVAIQITLPSSPTAGKKYYVKDGRGVAAAFNITIASTLNIDGSPSTTIDENYGSITLIYDGSTWNII